MTDNLPTIINQQELDAFIRANNISTDDLQGGGGDFLPNLKINYDEEDVNGKAIKKGLFFVTGQEVPVYAETVSIRVLLQDFQWTEWDPGQEKITNRTIFVKDLTDEARDEKGTLKCGKPASKILRDNKELAAQYEDITAYRTLHVLVSYTGQDADGNEHTIENLPAAMRLKGSNFMPFDEEYIKLLPKGSLIWDYNIQLSARREKQGKVFYWVIEFAPDFTSKVPLTVDVFETAKAMQTRLNDINKEIEEKYLEAVNKRSGTDKAIDALDITPRVLSEDFDAEDDIPF